MEPTDYIIRSKAYMECVNSTGHSITDQVTTVLGEIGNKKDSKDTWNAFKETREGSMLSSYHPERKNVKDVNREVVSNGVVKVIATTIKQKVSSVVAGGNTQDRSREFEWADSTIKLHEKSLPVVEGKDGSLVRLPKKNSGHLKNFADDAYLLEIAGLGFSDEDTYRLHVALTKLMEEKPLTDLHFWGKILGTQRDYYIAEARLSKWSPAIVPPNVDPKDWKPVQENQGTGMNGHVYFVCNSPGEEWVQLPDVTPEQINFARKIRRYFTGNLEADVKSFPRMDWKEKNYLRAQIARISHGTTISPKGMYALHEGDEEPEPDEYQNGYDYLPYKLRVPADLSEMMEQDPRELDNWAHHYPVILTQQATTQYQKPPKIKDPDAEEEEEEEDPDEEVETPEEDEPRDFLSTLAEDKPEKGEDEEGGVSQAAGAWRVRVYAPNKAPGPIAAEEVPQYGVVAISSSNWPGAVTVTRGNVHWVNVYIGWGHKATSRAGGNLFGMPFPQQVFNLALPPNVQEEYINKPAEGEEEEEEDPDAPPKPLDLLEQVEPTHQQEIEEIERAQMKESGEGEEEDE